MPESAQKNIRNELVDAVERLNCGILARDSDLNVVFANERLLNWLSYTWNEVVGHPTERLFPPELREVVNEERELIESGDVRARIGILRRKDSTTFPVLFIPQMFSSQPADERIYFSVVVDLGTVQTAKPVGHGHGITLRSRLDRIALELQSLGLASDMAETPAVPVEHPDLDELSDRQKEVLVQLVSGERVAGIAKSLHISPHTVRNHLKSMYRQLGVSNQAELIAHVRSLRNPDA